MGQDLCQLCVDITKAVEKSFNKSLHINEEIIDIANEEPARASIVNSFSPPPSYSPTPSENNNDQEESSDDEIPLPLKKTKRNLIFEVDDDNRSNE